MKSILAIIKATFLGGILFLAPLILVLVLLEKGFSIVQKIIGENIMGFGSDQDLKDVLVSTDAGWQSTFVIEQIYENNFSVFIPEAPNPLSGPVSFVEKKASKKWKWAEIKP